MVTVNTKSKKIPAVRVHASSHADAATSTITFSVTT